MRVSALNKGPLMARLAHRVGLVITALAAGQAVAKPPEPPPARSAPKPVSQTELQEDLQRFAGEFFSRLADASAPLLKAEAVDVRELTLRQLLRYESSALDIATGPAPEVDLLDMYVFIGLSRSVLARHWLPKLGEPARPILETFDSSQRRLDTIASRVLTAQQLTRLRGTIEAWVAANPDRVNVEGLRFTEFSRIAGRLKDEAEPGGLLKSVKDATQAADQAVLAADRMRFLASRLPFLLRLQTRLGVSEVTSDSLGRLDELGRRLEAGTATARPLVREMSMLTQQSKQMAQETRALLTELDPILHRLPPPNELQKTLGAVERLEDKTVVLLDKTREVLVRLDAVLPEHPASAEATLTVADGHVDRLMRRGTLYLIGTGAAWSLLFWGGYVLAKTLTSTTRHEPKPGGGFWHRSPRH
jgi:hypothetical protein